MTLDINLPRTVRMKDGRECILRRTAEADAEEILDFLPKTHVESDFLAYLPGEFNKTLEEEREFIRAQDTGPNTIFLTIEHAGRIIALSGAHGNKFKRNAHHAELGLTVAKAFWGQGLGRIFMEYLIAWAESIGLRKLTLRVFEDNHRGIALYKSLGFVEEGRLKDDVLRVDGRYSDTIVMARTIDDRSSTQ